ncbi:hypothetical protein E2C01_018961 [Portunus trituberculatus]|uniref:Secreted protein n=1 Tax=Portunus trituberculatus TaxID=210409 RepID=A0A5B7DWN9_PORTR|nr:hypothetical protein [Portunus trituberculatus]
MATTSTVIFLALCTATTRTPAAPTLRLSDTGDSREQITMKNRLRKSLKSPQGRAARFYSVHKGSIWVYVLEVFCPGSNARIL